MFKSVVTDPSAAPEARGRAWAGSTAWTERSGHSRPPPRGLHPAHKPAWAPALKWPGWHSRPARESLGTAVARSVLHVQHSETRLGLERSTVHNDTEFSKLLGCSLGPDLCMCSSRVSPETSPQHPHSSSPWCTQPSPSEYHRVPNLPHNVTRVPNLPHNLTTESPTFPTTSPESPTFPTTHHRVPSLPHNLTTESPTFPTTSPRSPQPSPQPHHGVPSLPHSLTSLPHNLTTESPTFPTTSPQSPQPSPQPDHRVPNLPHHLTTVPPPAFPIRVPQSPQPSPPPHHRVPSLPHNLTSLQPSPPPHHRVPSLPHNLTTESPTFPTISPQSPPPALPTTSPRNGGGQGKFAFAALTDNVPPHRAATQVNCEQLSDYLQ
ncbi:uncharacterized protein [Macaca nemestrina]|uniref:uncharacterized protein n=1 Tax=Macaca nemestrina TaxID=9545 RepID=UPI0039B8760F